MERFMLDGGIYIDWSCNGVKQLPTGVFIPFDDLNTDDKTIRFKRELDHLIKKWRPAQNPPFSERRKHLKTE